MKQAALSIGKVLLLLLCLNLIFLLLLALCYLPPNAWVAGNVETSLAQLAAEGDYVQLASYGDAAQMDNFTERMWIQNTIKQEAPNSFLAAISMYGLSKFWNGYLVWLRPLLFFFNYRQIRFLFMVGVWLLLFRAAFQLGKKLGDGAGAAFILAIGLCQMNVVTYNMGLSMDFIIMAAGVLAVCRWAPTATEWQMGLVFTLTGALYIFLNFLMAPLLTLLIPLCVAYFLRVDRYAGFWPRVWFLVRMCLWWALGFGFTWAFRWLVTLVVLGPAAVWDSILSIGTRTGGTMRERAWTLFINIRAYLSGYALPVLCVVAAVWAVLAIRRRKALRKENIFSALPALLPCFIPYGWIFVLSNHSYHHFWYTYRIQAGVLFAALMVAFSAVRGAADKGSDQAGASLL